MRLKSEIWVLAFIRRCEAEGKSATVLARGHADAGAVYVVANHLDGTHDILAPAPGPAYDERGNRRFERANAKPMTWLETKAWLDRRRKSDSDIWVVEVEDRDGFGGLESELSV